MDSWEVIWGPDCIRHICPFMIRTCCSGTGQIMCNVSRETVRLRWAFSPQQAHRALVTCFCSFLSAWHMFVCVWNENSTHQWTQRIKDVVFLFPKSNSCVCLRPSVLLLSFLWETAEAPHTGYGFFVFWLTTGVAHGEPCYYGYWFLYMVSWQIHQ